jgi:hypothetical protein
MQIFPFVLLAGFCLIAKTCIIYRLSRGRYATNGPVRRNARKKDISNGKMDSSLAERSLVSKRGLSEDEDDEDDQSDICA